MSNDALLDLTEDFNEKYGDDWGRKDLSREEEKAWVESWYIWYEEEVDKLEGFRPLNEEDDSLCNLFEGYPFEIVSEVTEEERELSDLPLWKIKIIAEEPVVKDGCLVYPPELLIAGPSEIFAI